jgi:hypothetical protein
MAAKAREARGELDWIAVELRRACNNGLRASAPQRRARASHALGRGHRRSSATRAGPSDDPDDHGPGEAGRLLQGGAR